MNDSNHPNNPTQSPAERERDLITLADRINEVLKEYSDKDWNYSRINLESKPLDKIVGPYALWIDVIVTNSKQGRNDFQTYAHEVSWGIRHSSELGILELVSLRLNKALVDSTNDETWNYSRPVIRLSKKEDIEKEGLTTALWYQITEVAGDEFDNR